MKRKNLFIYIILLIVVCVAGYFTWNYFDSKKIQVPYSDFYKQMSLGKVETVTIKENQLEYELKDPSTSSGTTGIIYKTENQ